MLIRQIATPSLALYSYIVADSSTKLAAVIDPPRSIEPILRAIEAEGLRVTYILETHVHADFVSGSQELRHALGDDPIIACSALGGPDWTPHYAQETVQDRDVIEVGKLRLEAWHTPGHTPEHVMWVIYDEGSDVPNAAITGDFLFVGSVGRPDLLGGDSASRLAGQLYHSIQTTLPQLPDALTLYPAHAAGSFCGKNIGSAPSSTLGEERRTNPELRPAEEAEWTRHIIEHQPHIPRSVKNLKHINVVGPGVKDDIPPLVTLTLEEVAALDRSAVMVCDLRSANAFAGRHIAGSVNLPRSPKLSAWAADVIDPDLPVYLVLDDANTLDEVVDAFRLVGVDQILGYAIWDDTAATQLGDFLESFPLVVPSFVEQCRQELGNRVCILDVRTPVEWNSGHIPGAVAIEFGELLQHLDQIPRDQPVATICRSGQRASIAASLLRRAGYHEVGNIAGGMEAWIKAGLPIEK